VFEAYGDHLAGTDPGAADDAYRRGADEQRSFAAAATSGGEGTARMAEAARIDAKRRGLVPDRPGQVPGPASVPGRASHAAAVPGPAGVPGRASHAAAGAGTGQSAGTGQPAGVGVAGCRDRLARRDRRRWIC